MSCEQVAKDLDHPLQDASGGARSFGGLIGACEPFLLAQLTVHIGTRMMTSNARQTVLVAG